MFDIDEQIKRFQAERDALLIQIHNLDGAIMALAGLRDKGAVIRLPEQPQQESSSDAVRNP